VKPLQALKDQGASREVLALEPEPISYHEKWGEKEFLWAKANIPNVPIQYYVGKSAPVIQVEVYDEKNNLVRKIATDGQLGFHLLYWDAKIQTAHPVVKTKRKSASVPTGDLKYAGKGKYKFKFLNGESASEINVEIK
jgi:hypothetical protein